MEATIKPTRTPGRWSDGPETLHDRRYAPEEKVRIVIEGIRGEISVSALCRREGINFGVYYKWLNDYMEAGKSRLRGDTVREANKAEVGALKRENERLK